MMTQLEIHPELKIVCDQHSSWSSETSGRLLGTFSAALIGSKNNNHQYIKARISTALLLQALTLWYLPFPLPCVHSNFRSFKEL
jgi:hypothetical protein